ncbi:uncharacterized protein VP01_9611g1, partial [Puccinia sorghi]
LLEKKLGPFKIKSVVSKNAFKLSLPSKWKAIHPFFHVTCQCSRSLANLTKIELPGNPPTIFETPPTWVKTFIPLILKNLTKLKLPFFKNSSNNLLNLPSLSSTLFSLFLFFASFLFYLASNSYLLNPD